MQRFVFQFSTVLCVLLTSTQKTFGEKLRVSGMNYSVWGSEQTASLCLIRDSLQSHPDTQSAVLARKIPCYTSHTEGQDPQHLSLVIYMSAFNLILDSNIHFLFKVFLSCVCLWISWCTFFLFAYKCLFVCLVHFFSVEHFGVVKVRTGYCDIFQKATVQILRCEEG